MDTELRVAHSVQSSVRICTYVLANWGSIQVMSVWICNLFDDLALRLGSVKDSSPLPHDLFANIAMLNKCLSNLAWHGSWW